MYGRFSKIFGGGAPHVGSTPLPLYSIRLVRLILPGRFLLSFVLFVFLGRA